jgi:hypothetical protein
MHRVQPPRTGFSILASNKDCSGRESGSVPSFQESTISCLAEFVTGE